MVAAWSARTRIALRPLGPLDAGQAAITLVSLGPGLALRAPDYIQAKRLCGGLGLPSGTCLAEDRGFDHRDSIRVPTWLATLWITQAHLLH